MLDPQRDLPAQTTGELTADAFVTERDRVCAEFAAADSQLQPGQLTRAEYAVVWVLIAVSFVLVLVLQ